MVDAVNPVTLTADVVVLSQAQPSQEWQVLLVRRVGEPFTGRWALPGGHVHPGENCEQAARRELAEETGLIAPAQLHLVGVYDTLGRDPWAVAVAVAYVGVLAEPAIPATEARWVPVREVADDPVALAFDHDRILCDAAEQAAARDATERVAEQVWELSARVAALVAAERARLRAGGGR